MLAGALLWAAAHAQIDLDCQSPAAAKALIGQTMLSEIEGAEDISRAAMWEAFGRCDPGPDRPACVSQAQKRFESAWDREKAAIEMKYRRILEEFEARCRSSPA